MTDTDTIDLLETVAEEDLAGDGAGSSTEALQSSRAEKLSAQLDKVVNTVTTKGLGPLTGSIDWAEARLAKVQGARYTPNAGATRMPAPEEHDDIDKVIKKLIVESIEAAGVAGFVTGLGGLITLPVTIPANIAGGLVINARLAAAIAYLRGFDPSDPHVRTVVTMVAIGSSAQQVLKSFGLKVGEKVAMQAIKKIPMAIIHQVNKKVGFMLIAKYGTQRSVVTLAKGVPLLGGVVGGAVDATMTGLIGRTASAMFAVD